MKSVNGKTIIKIGLLSCLLYGASFFTTFANQQKDNSRIDCHIFSHIKNGNYNSIIKDIGTNIIVKSTFGTEKLKIALANLHAQCCASQSLDQKSLSCSTTINNWKNRNNFPESTNLLDHLVDVQIRSWKSDTSYKGLPLDENFKKRRDTLRKNILETKGKLPSSFNQDYIDNRGYNPAHKLPAYGGESIKTFIANINQSTEAINATKNWNLRTKYLNTCPIAIYLSFLIKDTNTERATLANAQCIRLVNTLIANDINFLDQTITYKSNKYITDTIEEYAINYFGERASRLLNDMNKTNSQLLSTVRQINKLVSSCN